MTTRLYSLLFLTFWLAAAELARGQGSAFTYQGRLNSGTNFATGLFDLTFTLFSVGSGAGQVGSPITNSTTGVTNGLFTTTLDFGAGMFPGANRWLEIGVRTNGPGAFTTLSPRQRITATPYAITASNVTGVVPSGSLSGTYGSAVTFNNAGNNFTGNGAGLTTLNASRLTSGQVPSAVLSNAWKIGGNSGTTAGTHFLGTTDNQPLEIKVNGARALRLEPNTNGAPNMIGGSPVNFVAAGVVGATIDGGGATNYNGDAYTNSIGSDFGVIGGGLANNIAASSPWATIAGGQLNDIGASSFRSAIGGGFDNNIADNSEHATIAGGYLNDIGISSYFSAIGGGFDNNIAASSPWATIAGGQLNDIGASSFRSAIGGGFNNNIADNSPYGTIAGGYLSDIGTASDMSAIGGGLDNNIAANSPFATIAGGYLNDVGTASDASAIGGGLDNNIAANSPFATIPGGRENAATAYAFAAGRRAKANHTGAFVWADSTDADFASTAANQFLIRAGGGVGIAKNNPATALDVNGTVTATAFSGSGGSLTGLNASELTSGTVPDARLSANVALRTGGNTFTGNQIVTNGSVGIGTNNPQSALHVVGTVTATAFNPPSDRNLKENFAPVNPREVLEKVAALPISRWNFKEDAATPHVGPMAQDFHAAFGLGTDDKHIATVDADGVALAAIQGLNQKVEEKDAEIKILRVRLEKLEKLLSREPATPEGK